MKILRLLALLGICALALSLGVASFVPEMPGGPGRDVASKSFKDGNYREAYDAYRSLTLEAQPDEEQIGKDLEVAIDSLRRLGRSDEIDALRGEALAAHPDKWRLLASAGWTIFRGEHHGQLIGGKLFRGSGERQGRYVNTWERDRVDAIRLTLQAVRKAQADDPSELARVYFNLAQILLNDNDGPGAWRLPRLTDLEQTPDFDNAWARPISLAGAPVEAAGAPVFYREPTRWEDARNDGERWRWALARAVEADPSQREAVRWQIAQFLRSQFGVETFLQSLPANLGDDMDSPIVPDPFRLATLADDETLAKLASGARRFRLPDAQNPILHYRQLATDPKGPYAEKAMMTLAEIHEMRNQYDRAAGVLRDIIRIFGASEAREARLRQIERPLVRIETGETQPAGRPGSLTIRHRNASRVAFQARRIRIDAILADIQSYIRTTPEQIDWRRVNLGEIGRVALSNPTEFLDESGATWAQDLTSPTGHFDRRTRVATPVSAPGAYLVTANVEGGNTVHGVIWLVDTVLFKRTVVGQTYYQVADAATGKPVPYAKVDLFGYRQRALSTRITSVVDTKESSFTCDEIGRLFLDVEALGRAASYVWLATARGEGGRMAFHGFSPLTNGIYQDYRNDQMRKLFIVTDRPSYRPGQTVNFRAWHARVNGYQDNGQPLFTNTSVPIEAINARGDRVFGRDAVTDGLGSFAGEFTLASDAAPGLYTIRGQGVNGAVNFRVESESQAEHTVAIELPSERVALGSPLNATIRARTLLGEPLTDALVRYKVVRFPTTTRFLSERDWDWLYQPGYWWLQPDAAWLTGWSSWGFPAPPAGWQPNSNPIGEVVAEAEVPIGPDGVALVSIDTALARAIHGPQDQEYRITAEVADERRRIASAVRNVSATSRPETVQVWAEPGFGAVGEPFRVLVAWRDFAGKEGKARGYLELRKLGVAGAEGVIAERPVGSRREIEVAGSLPTSMELTASEIGQYRVAVVLRSESGAEVEGGCVLNVVGPGWDTAKGHRFNDLEMILDRAEYQPGETAQVLINAREPGSTVYLFVRPMYGVSTVPRVLTLEGNSTLVRVPIQDRDQPNIFVEAVAIRNGKVISVVREIPVPPRQQVVKLSIDPGASTRRPGQPARIKLKLEDRTGTALSWPIALTLYDRALDEQADGPNVYDLNAYYWGWRRMHSAVDDSSLSRYLTEIVPNRGVGMADLGYVPSNASLSIRGSRGGYRPDATPSAPGALAPSMGPSRNDNPYAYVALLGGSPTIAASTGSGARRRNAELRSLVRSSVWHGSIQPGADGTAEVEIPMPSQLGTWTIRAWTMGPGARVGQAISQVVTAKDLLARLEAPAFLVEGDEVSVDAVVSNRLPTAQTVRLRWQIDGRSSEASAPSEQSIEVPAGGEARVSRLVKSPTEGVLNLSVRTATSADSDEARATIPVRAVATSRVTNIAAVIPADGSQLELSLDLPAVSGKEKNRLDVFAESGLASVMIDALPHLVTPSPVSTEQTLQRFLPLVLAQRSLLSIGGNLNSEGSATRGPSDRSGQSGGDLHPAFDRGLAELVARTSLNRLSEVQISDGGWGWYYGFGEQSNAHATALVVLGLIEARSCDIALEPGVLDRGVAWLTRYQDEQIQRIRNQDSKTRPYRRQAEWLDSFVYRALIEAGISNESMLAILARDRSAIGPIGQLHLLHAIRTQGDPNLRSAIEQEMSRSVIRDANAGVAEIRMPEGMPSWNAAGSAIEANILYFEYLVRTAPDAALTGEIAKGLVRARRGGPFWSSVRATGQCVSALARYLTERPERPDSLAVGLRLGRSPETMLRLDPLSPAHSNAPTRFETDLGLGAGAQTLVIRKQGETPLYVLGLLGTKDFGDARPGEFKVRREFHRLKRDRASRVLLGKSAIPVVAGETEPIDADSSLEPGDVIEVRIEVEARHELEAATIEDHLAAGLSVLDLAPGYGEAIPNAFVERRGDGVRIHLAGLAKGGNAFSYRIRADRPGRFTALPAALTSPYLVDAPPRSAEAHFLIQPRTGGDSPPK